MERYDLYDIHRRPTGESLERGTKVPKGYYRLVVHSCIFGSDGRMLIQRRQPFKSGWAGMWDITAGGSAQSGDTSNEAASRELREEVGIDVDLTNVRPAMTIYFDGGFNDIYTINMDVDIDSLKLQESEVAEVKWATEEEILEMLKNKEFVLYKSSFISLLFFLRNHNGAFTHKDPTKKPKE
ncbi:MAG: NUDIX domain-containing protein [Eubacterium sp.]|nr:NUDIX domain-containing protein [Eubacterium sp.]